MDYDLRLAVFRAAGLAPEEGVPIILPNRMPGDSTMAFRVLVERGRARARGALLGRAFGLPKELFCVVVSFWRTSRDTPDDFDDFPPFQAPAFRR